MVSDEEYVKMAEETYNEALRIVRSTDDWKVEKEDKSNNVIVELKKKPNGKKIYRCTARINMPARLLIEKLKDTNNITTWNNTLTEARVLKQISDTIAISYQVIFIF